MLQLVQHPTKLWKKRLILLDALESNFYSVRGQSVADASNGISDGDHDGVDRVTEQTHGSADGNQDTDNDGLSDFEEIYYWRTNPVNADTDGDTYPDGKEIEKGFSPNGSGPLVSTPANSYKNPHGAYDGERLFTIGNDYSIPIDDTLGAHNTLVPQQYNNKEKRFEDL